MSQNSGMNKLVNVLYHDNFDEAPLTRDHVFHEAADQIVHLASKIIRYHKTLQKLLEHTGHDQKEAACEDPQCPIWTAHRLLGQNPIAKPIPVASLLAEMRMKLEAHEQDRSMAALILDEPLPDPGTQASRFMEAYIQLNRYCDALEAGLECLELLMCESTGITGLHRPGAVADWESLSPQGEFPEWLSEYHDAMNLIKTRRSLDVS